MKKTPRPKSQTEPSTTTPRPIPPLVAVIVGTCDRHGHFRDAWEAAPALAEAFATSDDGSLAGPKYNFVGERLDAAIAQSRANTDDEYRRQLADAVDILDRIDVDYRGQIESAVLEPAFSLGLALGLYLMTEGGRR